MLILEDLGEVSADQQNAKPATSLAAVNTSTVQGDQDYQAVWQLEMWKRAEEAKFKAYLK